jgi:hypothetical protein
VNVLEGHVADELGFDNGTDVREVGAEKVHGGDSLACRDGCLDLGEVLLGSAEELLGFVVVGRQFAFFGEGLAVRDEVLVSSMDCIMETL